METNTDLIKYPALREIAAKSPDAILLADTFSKTIALANDNATAMFGIRTGDPLDRAARLIDSVAPEDRAFVKNRYDQARHTSAMIAIEFRLIDSTGQSMWVSCDTITIDDNRFVYVVARNITKLKEHENYLVEYGTRKNTLLDTVMHQLSGSLGLMNNLALKANKTNISDKTEFDTFVSLVQNNSQHCIRIIDDLIREEYNEARGIQAMPARVEVVKIVKYIYEEVKKSCGERRISFNTTDAVIFTITDDFKLLQIINNLVSNSLKFTRENDEINIGIEQTPESVVISVADTGIGIPVPLHPFIFEKHGPARRTGLSGEKSVGLGLSIANGLTQLLGGRIWFESAEGKGSVFYVELPKT